MQQLNPLENRQLTVLFCDLVDSTTISQKLSDEEWRIFLDDFQQTCTEIFGKFGGYIHEYRGDGPLVYFGYPTAYEDNAFRAVKACLELKRHFRERNNTHGQSPSAEYIPIQIRVGVHTGQVVAGNMRGRPTATGPMVALAERLQREAPPDGIVISDETLQLVNTRIRAAFLGERHLKGFDKTKGCYLVQHEETCEGAISPFHGRGDELSHLELLWRQIKPQKVQSCLITGGAGIGKSRLIREFSSLVRSEQGEVIKMDCSPQHQNSAFYPFVQALKSLFKISETDQPANLVSDLVAELPSALREKVGSAIEALLPELNHNRFTDLAQFAETRRATIMDALTGWLEYKSQLNCLLIIVEDANWLDPSSQDLLQRFAASNDGGYAMLLLSIRGEGDVTYKLPAESEIFKITGLSKKSAEKLIRSIDIDHKLSPALRGIIVGKSDGVPLYIEEMTKMLLQSANSNDNFEELDGNLPVKIPSSIQDLLTVRLNSVAAAKSIAQVAAVIGREFSQCLLQHVLEVQTEELETALSQLLNTGLIFQRKSDAGGKFIFKHALVADAAYYSVVVSRRYELHEKIARAIQQINQPDFRVEDEVLAHHFTEARKYKNAIACWMKAGQKAKRRFAQAEAIHHFSKCLELLKLTSFDTEEDSKRIELAAHSTLAACHEAIGGYSVEYAREAYERAEQIANELNDIKALLLSRLGLTGYYLMKGDFRRAYDLGLNCWDISRAIYTGPEQQQQKAIEKNIALAQTAFCLSCVFFHRAEFSKSIVLIERCLSYCQSSTPKQRGLRHDPAVMCMNYKAWFQWETGYPDTALATVNDGVKMAREGEHPFGICIALAFKACIHLFRREYTKTIETASESIEISQAQGYRIWLAWALVLRGSAVSEVNGSGIKDIEQGLKLWDESGAIVSRPFALAHLAEAYQKAGNIKQALSCINKAQETVKQFGEQYYLPEINRIYGNLLLCQNHNDANAKRAFKAYAKAIRFASERSMQSSVLRSNIALSKLNFKMGEKKTAIDGLFAALRPFREGAKTGDISLAKTLLSNLKKNRASEEDRKTKESTW